MARPRVSIRCCGSGSGGSGLPGGASEFQVLMEGPAGPEWGVVAPVGLSGPYVGGYDPARVYAVGDVISGVFTLPFALGDQLVFLEATVAGLLPFPDGSTIDLNDSRPWKVSSSSNGLTQLGFVAQANDESAVALGIAALAGYGGTAVGAFAYASRGVAVGWNAFARSDGGCAVGDGARADADYSTALGSTASAQDTGALAIGSTASAQDIGALAIGVQAQAQAFASLALGIGAQAYHQFAAAVGPLDSQQNYSTASTADYRMTLGYRELEVGHPAESEDLETALILRDENGTQYRLHVDTSGTLQVNPL